MAKISPYAFWQELDDNGDVLAGGKLYTYEAGTSTPKATYTDSTGSTANANPVILDSAGRADIWLDSGAYKFVLKDSTDVTIKTVDNITGDASNAFGSAVVSVSTNLNVTSVYENNILDCTGTITLSLLDVATAEEGFVLSIRNSGSGVVTIDPDGAELIDGAATLNLYADEWVIVVCNGTGWITLGNQHVLNKYDATTAPTANEDSGDGYSVGSVWVDVTNDKSYICVDATATAAVWNENLVAANNLSDIGNAATAFSNIKQAATDSATGVVELATSAETQTGTDATRAVTPDGLHAAMLGGVDQTLQDLTGSRAATTVYTNTTGRPIWIEICLTNTVSSALEGSIAIDGVATKFLELNAAASNPFHSMGVIVQDGSTYALTIVTGSLFKWMELR